MLGRALFQHDSTAKNPPSKKAEAAPKLLFRPPLQFLKNWCDESVRAAHRISNHRDRMPRSPAVLDRLPPRLPTGRTFLGGARIRHRPAVPTTRKFCGSPDDRPRSASIASSNSRRIAEHSSQPIRSPHGAIPPQSYPSACPWENPASRSAPIGGPRHGILIRNGTPIRRAHRHVDRLLRSELSRRAPHRPRRRDRPPHRHRAFRRGLDRSFDRQSRV